MLCWQCAEILYRGNIKETVSVRELLLSEVCARHFTSPFIVEVPMKWIRVTARMRKSNEIRMSGKGRWIRMSSQQCSLDF